MSLPSSTSGFRMRRPQGTYKRPSLLQQTTMPSPTQQRPTRPLPRLESVRLEILRLASWKHDQPKSVPTTTLNRLKTQTRQSTQMVKRLLLPQLMRLHSPQRNLLMVSSQPLPRLRSREKRRKRKSQPSSKNRKKSRELKRISTTIGMLMPP